MQVAQPLCKKACPLGELSRVEARRFRVSRELNRAPNGLLDAALGSRVDLDLVRTFHHLEQRGEGPVRVAERVLRVGPIREIPDADLLHVGEVDLGKDLWQLVGELDGAERSA